MICGCNEIEKRFEFRKRTIKWTLKVLKLNIKESHTTICSGQSYPINYPIDTDLNGDNLTK